MLRDAAVEVDLDGEPALLLREHVAEVEATEPTDAVTLLAGHDQWVLGPGTADTRVVPAARRAAVTRGAALVLRGGVVAGTWAAGVDAIHVTWFGEAGPPPRPAIAAEAGRLAGLLGRPLDVRVTTGDRPGPTASPRDQAVRNRA